MKASVITSAVKFIAATSILGAMFVLVPFKITLPNEVFMLLTGETLHNLFQSVGFFFPVKFFCSCIGVILAARFSGLFFNLIGWLYDKFF